MKLKILTVVKSWNHVQTNGPKQLDFATDGQALKNLLQKRAQLLLATMAEQ